ncbi:hypothetical protein SSX86_012266 [Deinandra increscens subsp. villosa]|uniref:Uncharacterized protein n=1 Tax=Deinandra increscens subsp. villosa TaxID=3103831 RepID=A0AAP0D3W4_9ASTR
MDMKYAVQTSILSRKWQHIWTLMPRFNLNSDAFCSLRKFDKFVANALSHRNNLSEVSAVQLKIRGSPSKFVVTNTVNYAYLHNLRQLTITWSSGSPHGVPQCLFGSHSLKNLTFINQGFSSFNSGTPNSAWDFPALETLNFTGVRLGDGSEKNLNLFSKCVNLKDITLHRCCMKGVEVLNVCAPELSSLTVTEASVLPKVFNIVAPQLETLTASASVSISTEGLASCSNFLCLSTVGFNALEKVSISMSNSRFKKERNVPSLLELFRILHTVKFLILDVYVIEPASVYQTLRNGNTNKHPSRKQFLDSSSLSDSESFEAYTSLSMDDFWTADSAGMPSTSKPAEVPQKRSRQEIHSDPVTVKVAKLEAEEKLPGAMTEEKRMLEAKIHRQDQVIAQQKAEIQDQLQVNEHQMAKIRTQDQVIAQQTAKIQMQDEIIVKHKTMYRAVIKKHNNLVAKQRTTLEEKMQMQDQDIVRLKNMLAAQNLQHGKLMSQIIKFKMAELKVQVESGNPDYQVIRSIRRDIISAIDLIPQSLRANVKEEFYFQYEALKCFLLSCIDASHWARIEAVLGKIRHSEGGHSGHSRSHVHAAELPPPSRPSPANICKDNVEVEVWLAGLRHLVSSAQNHTRRSESDLSDFNDAASDAGQKGHLFGLALECNSNNSRSSISDNLRSAENISNFLSSDVATGHTNMQVRTSGADNYRISVSNTPSCSTQSSAPVDDVESLGDVYLWGKVCCFSDGNINSFPSKDDVLTPRQLESNVVMDVQQIACGVGHFSLVTKQGEIFTCGEESGGRLGHGIDRHVNRPRLVEFLSVNNVDVVACGEFHTCAVSSSGDLYTWGDGTHNAGLLGHGTDVSHWIPKQVSGPLEGIQVTTIACGNWHSALVTEDKRLFTFGDGTYGALGHGDRESVKFPKEVASLTGLKTLKVACGVWHTAAIVEIINHQTKHSRSKKLFTWGDGDKYRLGHGNKETYTEPTCIASLIDHNFHQLACGHSLTVGLTTSGHVFTMGSSAYGQLGNPQADGKSPCLVQDKLVGEFVEEIACGAYHVAVLTSRSEVFTWGKGANGRLGHGDTEDRNTPTLVEFFKERTVKSLSCGANFTASICIHKWASSVDQSVCHGCKQAFGFTRKRRNCYNCGLVHCHGCSSRKAMKAALAPTPEKPHRVCDSCYVKLKKAAETGNNNNSITTNNSTNNFSGLRRKLSGKLERYGRTSRPLIAPTMEPVKYHEVKPGKYGSKSDSRLIVRNSQVPSSQNLKDVAFPCSVNALQNAPKPGKVTRQLPPHQPRIPASPYSRRPNTPSSSAPIFSQGEVDDLKKSNALLNQEVSRLQKQMKQWKQKSDKQDSDIRKLQNAAKQAESLASDKDAKCTIAVDVFKCIISQLNELTEKLPPEISNDETFKDLTDKVSYYITTHGSDASSSHPSLKSDQPGESSSEFKRKKNHKVDESEDEINKSTQDQENNESSSSNISEAENQKPIEVTEQFEPGVYVTALRLSDGTKEYKHCRFSKRRFNPQQAEQWWKENNERLFKIYIPAHAPPPAQENNEEPPPST